MRGLFRSWFANRREDALLHIFTVLNLFKIGSFSRKPLFSFVFFLWGVEIKGWNISTASAKTKLKRKGSRHYINQDLYVRNIGPRVSFPNNTYGLANNGLNNSSVGQETFMNTSLPIHRLPYGSYNILLLFFPLRVKPQAFPFQKSDLYDAIYNPYDIYAIIYPYVSSFCQP